jgi:S-DNA-T family DNA segregation ATPase FtsK/SpoIIIE
MRGFGDVAGIVFLGFSALLLVALFSYDPHDVSKNGLPVNVPIRNWIGSFGAWMGYYFLLWFGVAAYVVPVLTGFLGLGCFFEAFGYLRRRWPWLVVFMICGTGLLDLHGHLIGSLTERLFVTAGGVFGVCLNKFGFGYFGRVGATILFLMLYFISLLYLTNFRLGVWIRKVMGQGSEAVAGLEETRLERKAQQLKEREEKLRREVEQARKTGVGVDGLPVPTPEVRDLSVPVNRPAKARKEEPKIEEPVDEEPVMTITRKELEAATTADILGTDNPFAPKPVEKVTAVAGPLGGDDQETETDKEKEEEEKEGEEAGLAAKPAVAAKPKTAAKRKPVAVAAVPLIGDYKLPPLDLLNHPDPNLRPTESKEELMAKARLMQQTLAQFGIEVEPGDITKGPTITRYELHPAPGVKLEKIQSLGNNLAAALKAERIHILVPVPGKSSVGVEVPNPVKTKVIARDLLESEEWRTSKARVPVALGKDVYGKPIIADLADMPHLLIAGSTGSGKSVCINLIITSLLYRFSPDQLRFVMIDPKVVELQHYNALPHLVVPVVTDPKKVTLALQWVIREMEKRYQIFARVGVRNINSFNSRPKDKPLPAQEPELPLTARKEIVEAGADGFAVEVDEEIVVPREDEIVIPEKLSYIVVIIDELADLMLVAPADVEMAIARITQMARAAGIHCIVATQRPSVDVITGVIKANIPARIAFQVAQRVDSRTILDAMGADKLLGKGDMLYLPPGSAKLHRAQGGLITDEEINAIVKFISQQGKPSYEIEIHKQLQKPAGNLPGEEGIDEDETLIEQCVEVIRSEQKASVSLLQRRLRLGYTRAARIMDELENRGIVGPSKGAEPREILIDLDGTGMDGAGQQAV